MSETRKYYLYCEDNCKFEGMTKEQILTAIQQAVEEGEIRDVDTGFITKILEQRSSEAVKIWVGTESEFNALATKANDTLYIYDTDFESDIENEINKIKNGGTVVSNASAVNGLNIARDANGVLKIGDTIIPQKELVFTGDTFINAKTFTNITLSKDISIGDVLEIYCTFQTLNSSCFICATGKIKIQQDNISKERIFVPLFEVASNSKSAGMIEVTFNYETQRTIKVYVFNPPFANNDIIDELSTLKARIDKIYKVIE